MTDTPTGDFRFCPYCATTLDVEVRGTHARRTCPRCGFVARRYPTVGVAVVVMDGDQILLGRRRWSYAGAWCIPCGHVEWDEDIRTAAVREFEEETGLQIGLGEVVAVHSNFHHPTHRTVGVWFRGAVIGGTLCAGDDLDDARYFPLDALPEPLAFPTDRLVLDQLRRERSLGPIIEA